MPKKNKKKIKRDGDGAGPSDLNGDLETMSTASQGGSICSDQSVDPFSDIGQSGDGEEIDEISAQEIFEEKLKEAVEGITEKRYVELSKLLTLIRSRCTSLQLRHNNSFPLLATLDLQSRINSMKSVCSALRGHLLSDFLCDRRVTLTDAVERCLKKGKSEEQTWAAKVLVLICVQLGLTEEGEQVFASAKPHLLTVLLDPSASTSARSKCSEALGICGFIASNDLEEVDQLMSKLESIFSKSYLKGDKTTPSFNSQICAMHCSALQSWALLLSISPPHRVTMLLENHLHRLPELLSSNDLDLKVTAGETIALFYELAREQDEDFEGPEMDELCEKLKSLATENSKHHTKKDRKTQRHSFRDILGAIENWESPEEEIKFGSETVYIDSWSRKKQYDVLCTSLESGMNSHLQENMLLRDIFNLGAPIPASAAAAHKASKNDRRLFNAAAFKARTKIRQKSRDKRMARISG